MPEGDPLNVLIVGGGTAALEAALHLQRVAGQRVRLTILAPDDHFATRAMAVLSPFAAGRSPDVSLTRLAAEAGAHLLRGRLASVDAPGHRVMTTAGEEIPYDELLIAVGGVQRVPFRDALAFGGPGTEERMHGLVQDVEDGYVRRIAFVVPPAATWPVPLYELALMTAERAYDMCQTAELTLLTPETAALGLFGSEASDALTARLADAGVAVRTGVVVSVPRRGVVSSTPAATGSPWTGSSRCPCSTVPPSAASRKTHTDSSPSTDTAACWARPTSTPPETRPTSRSSRADWPANRPTRPPRRSPPTPAPRSSPSHTHRSSKASS